MPARLRPTAPIAADAILVGDPGRALMLAQELLREPKMSNHARGLWGYSGATPAGHALTLQSTGMGGPSATVVLHDLAELGVRRAVRVGTCTGLGSLELGELVVVGEANGARPDPELTSALEGALASRPVSVTSLDALPAHLPAQEVAGEVVDMQTGALLRAASRLGVAAGALLVVAEGGDAGAIGDDELEAAAKRAGTAAAAVLSP
jgi:uridine phosphorylase